ncbi:MAG: phosphate starvation-inducible protein PhoH [Legionellales bacterium]|nr:phosphate starvation-inducible protein PhoH [Legionellales bacterium]
MPNKSVPKKKLFVLDTNVLLHDPSALFRFHEHDVYLPMVVLEELDNQKKGLSEVARNARQSSRFLAELLSLQEKRNINQGIALNQFANLSETSPKVSGILHFQINEAPVALPQSLPGSKPDNSILSTVLYLEAEHPDVNIILVSKDINLRIKAKILGITAEDYFNDQVIDDIELLHTGMLSLPKDFWEKHSKAMESWQDSGRTFYRLNGEGIQHWYPNMFLQMTDDSGMEAIVLQVDGNSAIIELATDYRQEKNAVWGITARNAEQSYALNLLMNPDIDFVSLQGIAGTGKTLLTLAAALAQTLDAQTYREIIMTRVTIPVADDIGFLPGTEEEKMTPWMGALMDNLEVLHCFQECDDWQQEATKELLKHRIKIRSLNFMRGRTFLNKFIIFDEAQNLTPKQMKTLITRAGPGTKVICLGDIKQIDSPYLTETTSGLTYVVDHFKSWAHSGHMTLKRGERSRLADHAAEIL